MTVPWSVRDVLQLSICEPCSIIHCTPQRILYPQLTNTSESNLGSPLNLADDPLAVVKSGFVKQGGGSPDEARLEQTPYPFQPH